MLDIVKNFNLPEEACRIFAYCRVDHSGEVNNFHVLQINNAGYEIPQSRSLIEVANSATLAKDRILLMQIMQEINASDILIVPNLTSLGAEIFDILETIKKLQKKSVVLYCLEIGWADLSSEIGSAVVRAIILGSKLGQILQADRIKKGLRHAEDAGKKIGRPAIFTPSQVENIHNRIMTGETLASIARSMGVSWGAISRAKIQKKQ